MSLTTVTLLIVATALPFSVALANTRTLLAHGRSAPLAITTVLCAGANLALNIVLVPHFGITGSAFATLLSYALLAWLLTLMVRSQEDRLPARLKAEFTQWSIVGVCLLTALIPWTAAGRAGRSVGLALVAAAGALTAVHVAGCRGLDHAGA